MTSNPDLVAIFDAIRSATHKAARREALLEALAIIEAHDFPMAYKKLKRLLEETA